MGACVPACDPKKSPPGWWAGRADLPCGSGPREDRAGTCVLWSYSEDLNLEPTSHTGGGRPLYRVELLQRNGDGGRVCPSPTDRPRFHCRSKPEPICLTITSSPWPLQDFALRAMNPGGRDGSDSAAGSLHSIRSGMVFQSFSASLRCVDQLVQGALEPPGAADLQPLVALGLGVRAPAHGLGAIGRCGPAGAFSAPASRGLLDGHGVDSARTSGRRAIQPVGSSSSVCSLANSSSARARSSKQNRRS